MTFTEFFIKYDIVAWVILAFVVLFLLSYFIVTMFFLKKKKINKFPKVDDTVADILDSLENKPKIISKRLKAEKVVVEIKKKKIEKKQEVVIEDDTKPYSPMGKKSKLSYAYWREFYLNKYSASSIVLVNMELTNGFHRLLLVKEKDEGFLFRGKKYIFDDENKYYNIDAKLYMFDYHEGIALAIRRKIPVTQIKKTLESIEEIDIEYAINPSTLQRFMTAKIAEGVMKGTQLDEFFRKLQMILIVTMIAVLVHLALFVYASGILKNVSLPF